MKLIVHAGDGANAIARALERFPQLGALGLPRLESQERLDLPQRVAHPVIDLDLHGFGIAQSSTEPELDRDLFRKPRQHRALMLTQVARLVIQHAERAHRQVPLGQHDPRVKTQMRIRHTERIGRHARIGQRVPNDGETGLQDHVRADGRFERRLANAQPNLGLEPLPAFIDEIDDGNRRPARNGREFRYLVVAALTGRIENLGDF